MPPIEKSCVSGEQRTHIPGKRLLPCPDKQVKMIGQQGPGVNNKVTLLRELRQSMEEILPVDLVPENLPPLDPASHNVMENARSVQSRLPWHGRNLLFIA
jgi:hypothetical protein